jgi:tRNA(fMet)-specific endonuclease VapC
VSLRFLLDTNILSSPISASPHPGILARLEGHAEQCAVPAPVWHELCYGCQRLPRGKRRQALEAYLEEVVHASFPILPYEEAAAAWHARERARLERAGRPAPYVDGQIAAIAHLADLTLVTRNTRDFRRFEGVALADWSKPPQRS